MASHTLFRVVQVTSEVLNPKGIYGCVDHWAIMQPACTVSPGHSEDLTYAYDDFWDELLSALEAAAIVREALSLNLCLTLTSCPKGTC